MIVAYDDVSSASSIEYSLNPRRDRLLVPSTLSGKRSKYSEAEGFENYTVKKKKKEKKRQNNEVSCVLECKSESSGYMVQDGQAST